MTRLPLTKGSKTVFAMLGKHTIQLLQQDCCQCITVDRAAGDPLHGSPGLVDTIGIEQIGVDADANHDMTDIGGVTTELEENGRQSVQT